MQFSTTLFRSVYLAVALAAAASAAPFASSLKYRTIQTRSTSSGLTVESFHPESSFEVRIIKPLLPLLDIPLKCGRYRRLAWKALTTLFPSVMGLTSRMRLYPSLSPRPV